MKRTPGAAWLVLGILVALAACGDVKSNTPADARKADAAPDTTTAAGNCKFDIDKFDTSCTFAP